MAFIRSVLHMLWLIVTVIPWTVVVMVASIFWRGEKLYRLTIVWNNLVRWGTEIILGIKIRVQGLENLPPEPQPAVLLGKHQSAYETIVLPVIQPRTVAYVFKKELLRIPFFGWSLGRLEMIHIDRSQGSRAFAKIAQQGQALLEKGLLVVLFPEGTRVERGQKGQYKTGGARLAIKAGAPIYPMAMTTARCWPPHGFIKRSGVIDFSIGPAIQSVGRNPDELTREVEAWIETEMRRLDPEAYPETKPEAKPEAAEGSEAAKTESGTLL